MNNGNILVYYKYISAENKEIIITKLEHDIKTNEYYYIFKISSKGA